MKNIFADAIEAGEVPYGLKALNKDIMTAIVKDTIVNAPRPKGRGFYRFCEQTASPV